VALTCTQCTVRPVASTSASSFRAYSTSAMFAFGCQRVLAQMVENRETLLSSLLPYLQVSGTIFDKVI
jgi:hypothetical protein